MRLCHTFERQEPSPGVQVYRYHALAPSLIEEHDMHVEEQVRQLYFKEEQYFSLWIRAITLLPVVVFGGLAILMWVQGIRFVPIALVFTALTLFSLLLSVPSFIIKLVTRVDSSHLHLRIYPLSLPLPFLPPRIRDVALGEISHWEVRTYRPLLDREYWGTHFWSLGSAFGGARSLYVMKANLISAQGVQLELRTGERLLIGTTHPEELANAITLARTESN
jgi:hypothetical protein